LPAADDVAKMRAECPLVDLDLETRKFADYWLSAAGKGGVKLNWGATWRNWIRKASQDARGRAGSIGSHHPQLPYVPQSKIDRENAENEMRPSLLPMPSILTEQEQARYEASRAEALRKRAAGERVPGLDDVRDQLRLIGGE
jgi:hypothetical protein